MNEFYQRLKPVHLAIFSSIAVNFAGYAGNLDGAASWAEVVTQSTLPQSQSVEQSANPSLKLSKPPIALSTSKIQDISEIREIQSTNFLPKLPPATTAQAIYPLGSNPIVNSGELKSTAPKIATPVLVPAKVSPVPTTDPVLVQAPEKLLEKSPEKIPEKQSEIPKSPTAQVSPPAAPASPNSSGSPQPSTVPVAPATSPQSTDSNLTKPADTALPSGSPKPMEISPASPGTAKASDAPNPPGTPGISAPRRTSASNSTVFDTGIRPTPALTVPTTPSQIKIERTQPIRLEEALQIAETNSQVIRQAAIAVQRARAVVDEAAAARNPNVDVQGSYSFVDSADARQSNIARSPLFGSDNSTITQPLSGTVQLSYNVFTSGLNEAQIKAAEERLRATEADLTRIRQSTFLDITNAYIDLQDTDETVRIRTASVNARRLSLRDTQSLERAGVGTRFDVLQAEVQLSNAQQQLLTAQNNQQVRRRTLAQQLQYPPTLNLSAADPIAPAPDWKLSLEETILQALRNRSELDIQKLTASASLSQARAEIARLGPQVALTASADLRDNFSNVGGLSFGYTLGARVSWRLFDGGVANARVRQFESDRDLAESRFDQNATQIRLEVESAYFSLNSTRDQIVTSARAVQSAAEALRLARLRLTAGVGTQLEVIRAEEDLTQAEVNRSTAIIGFNRAQAALARSLNTVSPR
jgi:outer membrane protein TolC